MKKWACEISYDGTGFAGYQVQPGKRTVQLELETALKKIHKGFEQRVHSSGRTDAGVHAIGQVFHFDSSLQLTDERWKKALNALLPADVRVRKATEVATDFHARYSAVSKQYHYRMLLGAEGDVFRRKYTYHIPTDLNIAAMKEAALHIVGEHDFSAFCASNTSVVDKVRTVTMVEFVHVGDELLFKVEGNGFLYNMVRIIVGTLVEVGQGKREPKELKEIIDGMDRTKAGKTAPGHGLYLYRVNYEPAIFKG
ncbi:tRNA pseudouridine(38-40) synthase TruA [Alkalihalobacillus pseudalcaliphilus]|uniref:tRNA pseudouridine(38-40) synthase TruA n=1 Tax=Alkalihalobacillus pseudalcaliphilus TaxID=79884 RepID=UPI00064DD700|nr:tRNA pseudouridine(38-40) synthase TruA [Alkalihalobacillus pseudalcaliphilus]KMK74895.1 tRNA pseudouridine synthase A [Alkalihalobacillus pseudalcaliphilus]